MSARATTKPRVRLVPFKALFARCPICDGFMVAVGRLSIEVDGIEPCNECCTELLGEQRFIELWLEAK